MDISVVNFLFFLLVKKNDYFYNLFKKVVIGYSSNEHSGGGAHTPDMLFKLHTAVLQLNEM